MKTTPSEMNDLGHLPEERGMNVTSPSPESQDKPIYPSVTLSSNELPELEGATVEDSFEFHGVIEVVGVNEDEYTRGTEFRFQIKEGMVTPIAKSKNDTSEEDVTGIKDAKKQKGDHMNKLMNSDEEEE